jgi:hypothetical protein
MKSIHFNGWLLEASSMKHQGMHHAWVSSPDRMVYGHAKARFRYDAVTGALLNALEENNVDAVVIRGLRDAYDAELEAMKARHIAACTALGL